MLLLLLLLLLLAAAAAAAGEPPESGWAEIQRRQRCFGWLVDWYWISVGNVILISDSRGQNQKVFLTRHMSHVKCHTCHIMSHVTFVHMSQMMHACAVHRSQSQSRLCACACRASAAHHQLVQPWCSTFPRPTTSVMRCSVALPMARSHCKLLVLWRHRCAIMLRCPKCLQLLPN